MRDDYDWDRYPVQYRAQLDEVRKQHALKLSKGDYEFIDNRLQQQRDSILPLHTNHRLLYETILQLRPHNVMEIGCGAGDHLHNLHILAPEIDLFGCDVSDEQLRFARERSPDLTANLWRIDITKRQTLTKSFDLCFSQAVIMHIRRKNRYLTALSNMFGLAGKYVILMENWASHSFIEDIQELHDQKKINWVDLFFHYREAPELKAPHLMVVSSRKLEYPILTSYDLLRRTAVR